MDDGIGLAERLLGLDGFWVLEVSEGPDEVAITIATATDLVGCSLRGARRGTRSNGDRRARSRLLRSSRRLVWRKRRWRCVDTDCSGEDWTEPSPHVDAQVLLTRRPALRPAPVWASCPDRCPSG